MAVFTPLTDAGLRHIADAYGLRGELDFQGIADGIENSSFLIQQRENGSGRGSRWVLTIVEALGSSELEFVCSHLQKLSAAGIPVAALITSERPEEPFPQIAGKPALLYRFLEGAHIGQAKAHHCTQVGRELARAHAVGSDRTQACSHGWAWLQAAAAENRAGLEPASRNLLDSELATQAAWQAGFDALPGAVIHADLFRDNVLFKGDRLSGLIDWYSACSGAMVYDIAIALNDWCRNAQDQLEAGLTQAFLAGYTTVRELTSAERAALGMAQRRAALRFWLSRLQLITAGAEQESDAAILCRQKDPGEFERLLVWLRAQA